MHPDIECLLDYRDGKLNTVRRKVIEAHLRVCHECRLEWSRIDFALAATVSPTPEGTAPGHDEVLAGLMASIISWKVSRAEPDGKADAVTLRVASELGSYLGRNGTDRIMESVSYNAENLLSTVEPLLALFLGARAAAVLVNRIVDTAIVRS